MFENQTTLGKRAPRYSNRGDFDWPSDDGGPPSQMTSLAYGMWVAGGRIIGIGMAGVVLQLICSVGGFSSEGRLDTLNSANTWCFVSGAALVALSFCLSCLLVLD
jgi:hypothetical protein